MAFGCQLPLKSGRPSVVRGVGPVGGQVDFTSEGRGLAFAAPAGRAGGAVVDCAGNATVKKAPIATLRKVRTRQDFIALILSPSSFRSKRLKTYQAQRRHDLYCLHCLHGAVEVATRDASMLTR